MRSTFPGRYHAPPVIILFMIHMLKKKIWPPSPKDQDPTEGRLGPTTLLETQRLQSCDTGRQQLANKTSNRLNEASVQLVNFYSNVDVEPLYNVYRATRS